jgi:hypothetical protein
MANRKPGVVTYKMQSNTAKLNLTSILLVPEILSLIFLLVVEDYV